MNGYRVICTPRQDFKRPAAKLERYLTAAELPADHIGYLAGCSDVVVFPEFRAAIEIINRLQSGSYDLAADDIGGEVYTVEQIPTGGAEPADCVCSCWSLEAPNIAMAIGAVPSDYLRELRQIVPVFARKISPILGLWAAELETRPGIYTVAYCVRWRALQLVGGDIRRVSLTGETYYFRPAENLTKKMLF
jgi:hypothetical protein